MAVSQTGTAGAAPQTTSSALDVSASLRVPHPTPLTLRAPQSKSWQNEKGTAIRGPPFVLGLRGKGSKVVSARHPTEWQCVFSY